MTYRPRPNSSQLSILCETNQRIVHARICEKFPALLRIEGNKIQRGIVSLKYLMQSRVVCQARTQDGIVAVLVPKHRNHVRRSPDERLYNLRALRRKTSMMSFTSLTRSRKAAPKNMGYTKHDRRE